MSGTDIVGDEGRDVSRIELGRVLDGHGRTVMYMANLVSRNYRFGIVEGGNRGVRCPCMGSSGWRSLGPYRRTMAARSRDRFNIQNTNFTR